MPQTPEYLRILHFEDDALDARLVESAIVDIETPCQVLHVDRYESFVSALEENPFDLILCDCNGTDRSGRAALDAAVQRQPGVALIVVSGTSDEKEAVECLQNGAIDVLWKTQTERFVPVIKRAIREGERTREELRVVTALKEAAQQLKDLNEHLREQASLLDKTRDAIFVMDLDHRITYWNKGAERMYGWTPREAIGEVADTLFGIPAQDVHEAYEAAIAHDEWTGEMQRFTKQGKQLTIEAHWTIVRG